MAEFDVAIIGGGPAGSTVGTLLKKYNPALNVVIFERDNFPRDHVGESLLPLINVFLDEMGVWDKVEAANFPIKIGATYRWGSTPDLWNFEFLPNGKFDTMPRPGKYEGQRLRTAFQVDRAIYDKILLDHSRDQGCDVRENTKVVEVLHSGDNVEGLRIRPSGSASSDHDEVITARHYVDCSANAGILRRTLGVEVESPTSLRNVAIWDYWRNADWAVEVGVGGTRIQVMSLGYGWIWFIPLGPDRTSIGLVVPAEYLKATGKKPAELYAEALAQEPRVKGLLNNATSEGHFQTTNDWSYISSRLYGENWFLAGDSCGFADPILSAGLTLGHASAREVAYMILESDRGEVDARWMKSGYEETHRRRIWQHIRFADYWYGANAQFRDLVGYCSEIAKDSGLELDPDQAFQWLGTGGFANDDIGQASVGAYTLTAVKRITSIFAGKPATWRVNEISDLVLNLDDVRTETRPFFDNGRVYQVEVLTRKNQTLPLVGPFRLVTAALQRYSDLGDVSLFLRANVPREAPDEAYYSTLTALEAMLAEGWVFGEARPGKRLGIGIPNDAGGATIRWDPASAI